MKTTSPTSFHMNHADRFIVRLRSFRRTAMTVLATVCLSLCTAWGESGDGPISVGLKKQLLVDDYVIAGMDNLRRVLGRVSRANEGKPVMVADKPWESGRWGLFGFYGTVLHDGDKFRMWYNP